MRNQLDIAISGVFKHSLASRCGDERNIAKSSKIDYSKRFGVVYFYLKSNISFASNYLSEHWSEARSDAVEQLKAEGYTLTRSVSATKTAYSDSGMLASVTFYASDFGARKITLKNQSISFQGTAYAPTLTDTYITFAGGTSSSGIPFTVTGYFLVED